MIQILRQCQKEVGDFPEEIKEDLADALARLDEGLSLSMPLSRPMPSIGRGVHELRLKDRTGIYRVFYVVARQGDVWLVHAFKKKAQQTPQQNIELAKKRIKEIL